MSDFSFDGGSWSKGTISAVGGGLKYFLLPMLLLIGASSLIARFGQSDLAEQMGLEELLRTIVILGIPITILAFFKGFYPKGSRSRFVFGTLVTITICFWIWFVTKGGLLDLEFGDFGISLNYSLLIYLFIFARGLGIAFYLAELFSYRQEWLQLRGQGPIRYIGNRVVP
jgi:hypothetical protein